MAELTAHRPGPSGGRAVRSLRRALLLAAAVAVVAASLPGAGPGTAGPARGAGVPGPGAHPDLLLRAAAAGSSPVPVIVREVAPASLEAERLVERLGGRVARPLPIVGGFSARVPGRAVDELVASPAVAAVWGDGRVRMDLLDLDLDGFDSTGPNTVWRQSIRLPRGYTGAGVTVAVLDTGVTRVPDLGPRLLARVDFTPDHDGYDRYGHGTHVAGLVAGDGTLSGGRWAGAAPGASLVSVKVAGRDGSTDVSEVIAGLQWVVSNRARYGIRVLNLSFGTDSLQSYLVDPLDHAVEQVWRSGIFVVVAAGNRGPLPVTVSKPGDDPFVLTVGAVDARGTASVSDDVTASFSGRGPTQDGLLKPDVAVPGIGLVSNRAPGSTLDEEHPLARQDEHYFRGSGTSQAAAVVSGVAALMIQANPSITPDVIKAALVGTADPGMASRSGAGAGVVDASAAVRAAAEGTFAARPANRGVLPSTGAGSLELSRGTARVVSDVGLDGVLDRVAGEVDALGNAWLGSRWPEAWSDSPWAPYVYEAAGWDGKAWGGKAWGGTSWEGKAWGGKAWG